MGDKRAMYRRPRGARGTAIIEFAVCLLVFLYIVLGSIELMRASYISAQLTEVSRIAARDAATIPGPVCNRPPIAPNTVPVGAAYNDPLVNDIIQIDQKPFTYLRYDNLVFMEQYTAINLGYSNSTTNDLFLDEGDNFVPDLDGDGVANGDADRKLADTDNNNIVDAEELLAVLPPANRALRNIMVVDEVQFPGESKPRHLLRVPGVMLHNSSREPGDDMIVRVPVIRSSSSADVNDQTVALDNEQIATVDMLPVVSFMVPPGQNTVHAFVNYYFQFITLFTVKEGEDANLIYKKWDTIETGFGIPPGYTTLTNVADENGIGQPGFTADPNVSDPSTTGNKFVGKLHSAYARNWAIRLSYTSSCKRELP